MVKKRPKRITIICILGFIGFLLFVPLLFSSIPASIHKWYPLLLSIASIVSLVCMIGIWMMKKWGIITYTIFCIINQIILILLSLWRLEALLIPGIFIVIIFTKFKEME